GLSIIRDLKSRINVPVIMLTATASPIDRVVGLELGADDYVAKPCELRELMARIRSVLRRSNALPPGFRRPDAVTIYAFDGWTIDTRKRTLSSPQGALVELTSGEFDLLHVFVEHANEVLSRDQLLDLARGRSTVAFDRAIDVQISRLRRKIEPDSQQPTIIKTVRSEGYIMTSVIEKRAEPDRGRPR
ncbi:MAG: winged helix-turn-helix domain-containing protein, partial [Beijerinckiaceae bacterium]|nr:winged helix-turn-helix domain-containing protein [Beijerinckiaceae bacterium]